ncbi:MAG: hypothetical protein ACRC10_03630 [Thermoguttaceae bacterium]
MPAFQCFSENKPFLTVCRITCRVGLDRLRYQHFTFHLLNYIVQHRTTKLLVLLFICLQVLTGGHGWCCAYAHPETVVGHSPKPFSQKPLSSNSGQCEHFQNVPVATDHLQDQHLEQHASPLCPEDSCSCIVHEDPCSHNHDCFDLQLNIDINRWTERRLESQFQKFQNLLGLFVVFEQQQNTSQRSFYTTISADQAVFAPEIRLHLLYQTFLI